MVALVPSSPKILWIFCIRANNWVDWEILCLPFAGLNVTFGCHSQTVLQINSLIYFCLFTSNQSALVLPIGSTYPSSCYCQPLAWVDSLLQGSTKWLSWKLFLEMMHTIQKKVCLTDKSCIKESLNLLMCADSSTKTRRKERRQKFAFFCLT